MEHSGSSEEARGRRTAITALPALGAIAASFFLPFVRDCGQVKSPLQLVAGGEAPLGLWITPRFAVAALLATLTGLALLRGKPTGRVGRMALASLVAAFASVAMEWVIVAESLVRHPGAHRFELLAAALWAVTATAVVLAAFALRRSGWARWPHLLAAYAVLTVPLSIHVLDPLRSGDLDAVGSGGYLFLAALTWLLALPVSRALRPRGEGHP